VFRFNGCWSSFRLLLFAFRCFRSFHRSPPVTVLSHRTSSHSLHAHPPDAHTSNLASLWCPACQDTTFCRQFAIPFSHRSERFFIALNCFRISSSRLPGSLPCGGRGHVYQKALRAKVEEDIFALISCILTTPTSIPTLPHQHPPIPLSIALPTNRHPPGCGLLIYTAVCERPLRSQSRWTKPHSWRSLISSVTPRAWGNRRKHYYKHLPIVVTLLPPCPPRDDGVFHSFPAAFQAPSTSLYQVFSLAIVTSCIFFPRSSCSIIGAFWLFSGSLCMHAYGHHCMSKTPLFLFSFVCRDLGPFYLSGVRCWFCCKWSRSFSQLPTLINFLRSLFCRTYRTHTLLL